ncbi:MAG: 50S ribosomal protein L11 methyltransferase [Halieaceae bacterium]
MSHPGWQELTFETTQPRVEALEDWLFAQGAVAVTLEDNADEPLLEPGPGETPLWQQVKVVALFNEDINLGPVIEAVPAELIDTGTPAPAHIPDQDWERAWMDNFHPMQMGERLWICPSWTTPPQPEAVNIILDPGLAFGTGTHPTTAMCLRSLDRCVTTGMQVIDFGCGTGILAIAALKLGAQQALAVDNDPQAITATKQNAERNQVASAQLEIALPEDVAWAPIQESADVVVANILAGPLEALAPQLKSLVKSGGRLILAGLLTNQAESLIDAYAPEIELTIEQEMEGWVLLGGKRC